MCSTRTGFHAKCVVALLMASISEISWSEEPLPSIHIIADPADPGVQEQELTSLSNKWETVKEDDALSASSGVVDHAEINTRPLERPGELLETVPGIIVTQHSGTGKANQYFLRGFNLDHGTDFRTDVEGMPVNMPSHGHGQGYSDLNFIIPEFIQTIDYRKGTYYAEKGDFSAAGAADIYLARALREGVSKLTVGEYGYQRALAGKSWGDASSDFLVGLEALHFDGPWEEDENGRKFNSIMRYTQGSRSENFSFMFLAYQNIWDSTDQIPLRLVESGQLSPFGAVNPTDGGRAARYSISTHYRRNTALVDERMDAFAIASRLRLFSDFTYFLDDPVNGDQFEQVDQRYIFGGNASHRQVDLLFGREFISTFGIQLRHDAIPEVGLHHTSERERVSTVRNDDVQESTLGLFGRGETKLASFVTAVGGLRADLYRFDVDSSLSENSGREFEAKLSPKGSLIFGPWEKTEVFLNGGLGFHSNDARGTTISVDPATGEPAQAVTPLVLAKGAEIGVRSELLPGLKTTATLWNLRLDSELLFIGDAGITEPSRASERRGVEIGGTFAPCSWVEFVGDVSLSHARFTEEDPAGDHIPGAVDSVISSGISLKSESGMFTSLLLRHFGRRPLIEDNSVHSNSTTVFNLLFGYLQAPLEVRAEVLNLFDSADHDIDYFYSSRLSNEPENGIEDIHFHPVEPRSLRVSVGMTF